MKWTNDQEETLKKLYGTMLLRELSKILGKHESSVCVKAKKLGLQSVHSKLMMEQLRLKKQNERRCSKCKQILPYNNKNFNNDKRTCKKCEADAALSRFYNLKENPTLLNLLKSRMAAAKSRSKKKNILFNLDIEYLLNVYHNQKGKCYYSGIDLKIKIESCNNNRNVISVDRINPELGYIKGNIVLCCDVFNTMKNNMNPNQFFEYIKILFDYQQVRNIQ